MKIIGIEDIEKETRRSYVDLLDLKRWGLPLGREDNKPALEVEKANEWCAVYGRTIYDISLSDVIAQELRERKYNCTDDRELVGASAIAVFLGWETCSFLARYTEMKQRPGCPIRFDKQTSNLVVNAKELVAWINCINKELMAGYKPDIRHADPGLHLQRRLSGEECLFD